MISFIICSIRPPDAELLAENIRARVGMDYELIVYDNRQTKHRLCRVYNDCAARAKGDVLAFAHEDICFHSNNWGETIYRKALEKGCGVIGFAGSTYKTHTPSGWGTDKRFSCAHFIQNGELFSVNAPQSFNSLTI